MPAVPWLAPRRGVLDTAAVTRSAALVLAALSVAACQPARVPHAIEVPAGQLAIVVSFGGDGDPVAGTIVAPGLRQWAESRPSLRHVVVWTIDPGRFIQVDGRPVPAEWFEGLQVTTGKDELRANVRCQRCIVPAAEPPAIVFPGDRCPPPDFAPVRVLIPSAEGFTELAPEASTEHVQNARAVVQLNWPGDCPPDPDGPTPHADYEICPIRPEESARWIRDAAIAADGAVMGLSHEWGIIALPGSDQPVELAGALPRHIDFLAALGGDTGFLARGPPRQGEDSSSFHLVARDGRTLELSALAHLNPRTVFARGHDEFLIGGRARSPVGSALALLRCSARELLGGGVCQQEGLQGGQAPCPGAPTGDRIEAVAELADGTGLAASRHGRLFVKSSSAAAWSCAHSETLSFELPEKGRLEVEGLEAVGVVDRRFFVCGRGATAIDGRQAFVLSVQAPARGDAWALPVQPRLEGRRPKEDCRSIISDPEDPAALLATFDDVTAGRLEASGVVGPLRSIGRVGEDPGLDPEIEMPVDHLRTSTTGWGMIIARGGTIFRRPPGGPFARLYGPAEYHEASVDVVTALDGGEGIAFDGGATPWLVRVPATTTGCDHVEVRTASIAGHRPDLGDRVTAIGRDGRTPGHYAAAGQTGDRRWLRRLQIEPRAGRVLEEIDLSVPPGSVRRVAWLLGDVFLLLHSDGELYALRGGQVMRLEPQATEPRTGQLAFDTGPDDRPDWEDVDAAQGVAWVAGEDVIGRVVVVDQAPTLRLEAYWHTRLRDDAFSRKRPPRFRAVQVLAPDRASFAADEDQNLGSGAADLNLEIAWELRNSGCSALAHDGMCLEPSRQIQIAGKPIAVHGWGASTVLIDGDGWLHLAEGKSYFLHQRHSKATAMLPGGAIVAGGAHGRLAVAIGVGL